MIAYDICCAVLHRFSLRSVRSKCHSNADTRYSMMETKVPDFVSAMSRTIKCNYHSKLLINQQGLFYTVKKQKKIVLYLQMFQHTKLYLSFSKISALALFLKFQPRYSYKYIIKKIVSMPSGPSGQH